MSSLDNSNGMNFAEFWTLFPKKVAARVASRELAACVVRPVNAYSFWLNELTAFLLAGEWGHSTTGALECAYQNI
jgi:hypothetical protein